MDTNKLCYSCFGEHDGNGPCPHCGFDIAKVKHPFVALPIGTILNGRYLTGRVLGVGGFGVTYVALDMTLEICVAIKEFLPSGIAYREDDHYTMTVRAPEEQVKFDTGASKFLEEARLLAKLRDVPNIVTVQDYFRENNTAYFVMEYIEGVDLMKYTQMHGGKLSYQEAIRLLLPIIDSLAHVHAHNLLHRDISPDNIVVMKNGSTRLLDFGAARLAVDSDKSKSIILKHGFAPEEQYRKHGNQGPWSDEYALAATMYLILTAEMPPDAIERVHEDTMKSPIELGVDIPQSANDALMKALAVRATDRFPDMASFSAAITRQVPVETAAAASPAMVANTERGEGMVQGRTVNLDETVTTDMNAAQPSVISNEQNAVEANPAVPENTNAQVESVLPVVPVTTPKSGKKSIWKRPLTYVLAGIVVLIAIAVPTGIYISNNYYWGDPEEIVDTKKTTKRPTASKETTFPDPSVSQSENVSLYTDSVRHVSIQIPNTYSFENNKGRFIFKRDDGTSAIYLDHIQSYNGMRVDSLVDFAAQADDLIRMYVEEQLGYTNIEYNGDTFTVASVDNCCGLQYSAYVYEGEQKKDLVLVAYESKNEKGVFLASGAHLYYENEFLNDDGYTEIMTALESFREENDQASDYVFYQSPEPYLFDFLYRSSDVETLETVNLGESFYSTEVKLKNMTSENSKLYVVNLGFYSNMTDACTAAEQAFGVMYKNGGFQSVTPLGRHKTETRVRNYTVALKSDASVTLDSTLCVLNMNGEYYAVIATCGDSADLEQLTLDFTMIVKSLHSA